MTDLIHIKTRCCMLDRMALNPLLDAVQQKNLEKAGRILKEHTHNPRELLLQVDDKGMSILHIAASINGAAKYLFIPALSTALNSISKSVIIL